MDFKLEGDKLISIDDHHKGLNGVELHEIDEEEWKRDDGIGD